MERLKTNRHGLSGPQLEIGEGSEKCITSKNQHTNKRKVLGILQPISFVLIVTGLEPRKVEYAA